MIADSPPVRISAEALRSVASSVFRATGSSEDEARTVGDHLVDANLAGHDSHGVIRVPKYLDWHARGMVLANRHVLIVREAQCHALVDGGFGYGQVIAREAMDIAVAVAKRSGLCAIALRNAGHLGRIGAWAEQVADAGLASVHFVNTSGFGLLVAPYGGTDRRLSANPIAAGAPMPGGPPLILDISTSAIAEGKIQVAQNRNELLPEGCIMDGEGRPTRDPRAFYGAPPGALLPFGGHKGYGLSVFCEILAGALTGGGSTHPDNPTAGRLVNNMMSIVFDPAAFCGAREFADDVARLTSWVKAAPPAVAGGEVLLPGEPERRTRAERLAHGIPLDVATRQQIRDVAHNLFVALPPEFAA